MKYLIDPFKNFLDFNGKSSIKEFWVFFLFSFLLSVIFGMISAIFNFEELKTIFRLVMVLPFVSIGFRRMNDAGFNKWLFLIPFLNLILAGINKNNVA
jgi:uncharacterized membrane protein YhaH (DUF805 family)